MYKLLLRCLFLMSPEKAHSFTMQALGNLLRIPLVRPLIRSMFNVSAPVDFIGLKFKNCIGLAAGFDKNAAYLHELETLGFGFVEIGTVTPLPQQGNEAPRLFRLKKDKALINRMGFNNEGVDAVVEHLKTRPANLIVGGNIGKNKATPNEYAQRDYEICFSKLYDDVDYFVVNVSSPNTPDLRALQDKEPLKRILSALMGIREKFVASGKNKKPVLLKIAPDLNNEQIDDVIEIVKETALDGIVATNTTIGRESLATSPAEVNAIGVGGLSGKVLSARSTEVIRYIHEKSGGSIPIMGVGGIHNVDSARDKLKAGAKVIQFYTAFIYEGPWLIRRIVNGLNELRTADGSAKTKN